MARMKVTTPDVPGTPDERMEELAQILARGVLRLETKKSGLHRDKRLDVRAKTRLSVSPVPMDSQKAR